MNKKGYTLIEILIVVAVIATIGITATVGLTKVIDNSKNVKYEEMLEDIRSSANTYLSLYPETEENLYMTGNYRILISDLQEALLLDALMTNPINNKKIDETRSYVEVTYLASSDSINFYIHISEIEE